MIHAFVIMCMVYNPTQCQEHEIVPADLRPIASQMDCAMGGFLFGLGDPISIEGVLWQPKGVRCKEYGSLFSTELQSMFTEVDLQDDQTRVLDAWGVIQDRLERLQKIIKNRYLHRDDDKALMVETRHQMEEISEYLDRIDKNIKW